MKKQIKVTSLSLVGVLLASTAMAGDLENAIKGGKAYADVRYRLEMVDQDGFANNANASTLRSRVGYKTATYKGFDAQVEFENITQIGGGKYYDGINSNSTSHPTVLDAETTEVNQAIISYNSQPLNTVFKVGRQAVNLDNQRFVGSVNFRQNDQTFDSIVAVNNSIKDVTAIYAYVSNIQTVKGDDNAAGSLSTETHLLNVAYNGFSFGKLTGYAYLLDVDAAPSVSSATYGARFAGNYNVNADVKALYEIEYATQSDYGNNTANYDESYVSVVPGVSFAGLTVKAGYELLSGNGTSSFQTPLATGHKFNGWADKFLSTPANGLEDKYLAVSYKVNAANTIVDGVKLAAAYHNFEADNGGNTYGDELDLKVSKGFGENYTASVIYADYNADTFSADTQKVWFTLGAKF